MKHGFHVLISCKASISVRVPRLGSKTPKPRLSWGKGTQQGISDVLRDTDIMSNKFESSKKSNDTKIMLK